MKKGRNCSNVPIHYKHFYRFPVVVLVLVIFILLLLPGDAAPVLHFEKKQTMKFKQEGRRIQKIQINMILSYGQHLSTLSDDFQQEVTPEKMRMSQKKT